MLRVTVELVPFGNESAKRKIAEAIIYNDGTGNPAVGNYVAGFCENNNWVDLVEVKRHKRAQTVWALVGKAATGLARKR